jgi:hypothetical protein
MFPTRLKKTLMGRRKYSTQMRIPLPKYQQLWIRIYRIIKPLDGIDFDELSPPYVSFFIKK